MRKQWFVLLVAMLASALLWGCGSGGGSGGSAVTDQNELGVDTDGTPYIGAGLCVDCHANKSFSQEAVAGYLSSKHVVHSTHINAESEAYCLDCHNPIGDGATLEKYLDPSNVPAEGLAAVGCESCHGAGGEHLAGRGLKNLTPDYQVCGNCHNALPESHIPHHPLADNILDNYELSAHFEQSVRNTRACMRCHSDEGFRTYIGETAGLNAAELDAFMNGKAAVGTDPIQCRTCHDPHSGEMRVAATMTHRLNGSSINNGEDVQVFSTQFNLCTSCHQAFLDALTYDETTGLFTYQLAGNVGYHDDGSHASRVITDTHFSDPANGIAGYNINAAAENACTNCHDPHAASKFEQTFAQGIAEEWANTPHFHGDYEGPAFEHGCTPCHSPEGLIELTVGGEYSESSTDVGVIACVACHDLQNLNTAMDGFELGELRESPEFAFDNARTLYEAALAADPNTTETLATIEGLGANALCMTCHQGRESTASVNAKIGDGTGTYSFSNIHYLAAAATLFGNQAKGAYEYEGKTYSSKFEHVASNDLCVECHNAHSGELYLADPGFGPTGCNNCHTGVADTGNYESDVLAVRDIRMNGSIGIDYDGDGNATEGLYYEVETLIQKLEAELLANGIMYSSNYPYFFPVGTTDFSRENAAQLTATQLKAAYNLQVASKDPGAYAHNGTYIIEILYDSLEDLGADVSGLTRDANGHFDAAGEPFRHWDEDGEMSTSCARCHSSEGAIAYFNNGDVTSADFSLYTEGISAGLACEVCHTAPFDPAGTTRTLTSVEFPSGAVLNATNASAFFANDSPLCMSCHQGRESGESIDSRTAGSDGTYRFVNIHYFAAAATLFGSEVTAGYEYAGKTYQARNTFPSAHAGAGYNTCAGCHMTEGAAHTFKPDITRCNGCHGGATEFKDLTIGVSTYYDNIDTLKAQLEGLLVNAGVSVLGGYPYFGNITTLQQLRAAYNLQVAKKDPCGYIHNAVYIEQILYDSIEDLGATPSVARPTGF